MAIASNFLLLGFSNPGVSVDTCGSFCCIYIARNSSTEWSMNFLPLKLLPMHHGCHTSSDSLHYHIRYYYNFCVNIMVINVFKIFFIGVYNFFVTTPFSRGDVT